MKRINELLAGKGENYILPFFWQHGEGRTDYINILDHDSVRVLIDQVYETHYARYTVRPEGIIGSVNLFVK